MILLTKCPLLIICLYSITDNFDLNLTFPLVSYWYRFLIFAPLLTLMSIIDTFDLMPTIDTFNLMSIIYTFNFMSIIDTLSLMAIIDTFNLIKNSE